MKALIIDILKTTRERESAHPLALSTKIQEELGEFSTEILLSQGYLKHKNKESSLWEATKEAADVVNCTLATLQQAFPNESPETIASFFDTAMRSKFEKYKKILNGDISQL